MASMRLRPLEPATRPALEALLAEAWGASWDARLQAELVAWRYGGRGGDGATWLAFDGDRCVALLDSVVRPWLLDGAEVAVRETCDWYCTPSHRPAGLGIALMRKMMGLPEPLLSIGGTAATLALLPKLRWAALPPQGVHVLPLTARGLAGGMLRRHWPRQEGLARAIPDFVPLRRVRPAPPPGPAARIEPWDPAVAAPLPRAPGLVELLPRATHDWLRRMPPALGRPLGLAFHAAGAFLGVSLSLSVPSAAGTEALIVHLQLAEAGQAAADWMVAETAKRLAAQGAGLIRCLAGSATKAAALDHAGFLAAPPRPAFWWSRSMPPPASLDAGFLRADDALQLAALRGRRLAETA